MDDSTILTKLADSVEQLDLKGIGPLVEQALAKELAPSRILADGLSQGMRRVGEDILRAWDEGAIRPEIAAEVPFSNAAEAHRMLGERRNLGKVLLIP